MNNESELHEHKAHGLVIGAATATLLSTTQIATGANAIGSGAIIGFASYMYMKRYGHGMPREHVLMNIPPHRVISPRMRYTL